MGFLMTLEFILAEAPCNMKRLLVGIWYALQILPVVINIGTLIQSLYITC